jgi:cytochrome c1
MSSAPTEWVERVSLRKTRRVATWLVVTLVILAAGAVLGIGLQTWLLNAQQRLEAISKTGGNPDNGPALLVKYGCVNCHKVPGMNAPAGNVGADLSGLADRSFIAGVLANTPENLTHWIIDPQSVDQNSAMPKTGITHGQARDVAAYLYAQP